MIKITVYHNSFNIIAEIKRRFSLEDAINMVGIEQSKRIGHKITALCPLPGHNEKTPSWVARLDKQLWTCYGCHEYGDQIDLVAKSKNRSNSETIKMLANYLGIQQDNSPDAQCKMQIFIRQREQEKFEEEARERQLKELVEKQFIRLVCLETTAERIIYTIQTPADKDREEVAAALNNLEYIRWYLDPLTYGDPKQRLEAALAAKGVEF